MIGMRTLAGLLVLAVPSIAAAQPETTADKSEVAATVFASAGTAVGIGLMAAGGDHHPALATAGIAVTLIAPSFGHLYAGEGKHAAVTTLIRTGAAAVALYGFYRWATPDRTPCADGFPIGGGPGDCQKHDHLDGPPLAIAGVGLLVG